MANEEKFSSFFSQEQPWAENNNSVWLASTISLSRNIEKFKFPGKLSVESKKQILTLMDKRPMTLDGLVQPALLKAEETSSTDREFLAEHYLTSRSFQNAETGEAFILDKSGEFLCQINFENHLKFLLIDSKGELEQSWNRLVKIESGMGKLWSYAFSPKFGFLTADPTQCGTALHVTVFLQLPALIHTEDIDSILENNRDDSLLFTGIHANPTEIIGDVLTIQNNYTLGLSEENIISNLRSMTTKFMLEEGRARQAIKASQNADVKDRVSRAYAILLHSYQIEAIEALNALSLLKLGVDLGWVTGVTIKQLNTLFFRCRRAHLLNHFQEKISQEELPHRRAEFIHQSLKKIKLEV